jgi:hypothetical protein
MKQLFLLIHLAALVLKCQKGQGRLWCSFPEASKTACSYRVELVSLMAIHLLLLAVNEVQPSLQGSVHIYSDCLGALDVINYGSTIVCTSSTNYGRTTVYHESTSRGLALKSLTRDETSELNVPYKVQARIKHSLFERV